MLIPAQKILIIKLRAIGDVIMSTIMLPNLRAAYPEAQIDFLTEKHCKEAVAGCHGIYRILEIPEKTLKQQVLFLLELKKERYDIVFDMFGNPRSALQTIVSGAKYRIGYNWRVRQVAYNRVVYSRSHIIHEAEWHLDALAAIHIPIISKNLCFHIPEQSAHLATQFFESNRLVGKSVIAINTSGGWSSKRWPLVHFANLANRIKENLPVELLLVWGPGELPDARSLSALIKYPVSLMPTTDLKQLGAFLKMCDLVISTDSGPMHIAAALNTPVVGVFGPTNPVHQGPYGEMHEVVVKKNVRELNCNRLDCEHPACKNALTVDDVWQAVLRCIKKNRLMR